jgi:hypothetical protein
MSQMEQQFFCLGSKKSAGAIFTKKQQLSSSHRTAAQVPGANILTFFSSTR